LFLFWACGDEGIIPLEENDGTLIPTDGFKPPVNGSEEPLDNNGGEIPPPPGGEPPGNGGGEEPPPINGGEPPANGGGEEPPPEPEVSFAQDIKPIFDAKCSFPGCHGDNPPSGLLLKTYDDFKRGGNSGPGLVPKNSADSVIMKRISPGGGMPPGAELPAEERNKIKDWIDSGGENN